MPKPWLSKSAATLRAQIDAAFPHRDKQSDGWIGDARHEARQSDHNPDSTGCVRAIDIDRDLLGAGVRPDYAPDLADQLRLAAKSDKRKRITYIIFQGQIASPILFWKWRPYKGVNAHQHHIHISFAESADQDTSSFEIPLLKGN